MGAWLFPLMLQLCFFFFFFISASSQTNTTACSQNDLDSLHGFLRGLSSPVYSWSLNSSACCAWAGVVCGNASSSTGTRVVGLDLFNMSLKGAVSDSLAGLDQLRTLNLSSNSLSGPVPSRLFQLRRLEQLDLSMNDLSGSVDDADLPSIRAFNISSNLFNGSHPVLPGSQNLTSFDISCNLFTGSIRTSICISSPGVEVLSFSVNSFTGHFPVGFGNCSLLAELAVDMNMITGRLPEDLFKLSAMTTLFIQDNQLSGALSPRISNLSNIARVDISLNSFSGTIPDLFDSFKHLESFSAQSNEFSGYLPPSLCNMSTIKLLSLRNNSLSGRISLNFGVMSSLCSLDLSWNSFSGRVPDEISLSSGLKMLNLGNNNLTGEVPSSLSNLLSLSYLSLSKNNISNISSALAVLQRCPSLTNLVLTKNFLSGEKMPSQGIDGFRNLEVLVIPNCGLRGTIPQWLASCSKLKVLDLSWNRLGGPVPSWVGSFDHLFYLDLSNNSLTGGIPGSLAQMKGLVSFDSSFPSAAAASMEDFPFFIRRNNSAKGLQYKKVSSFPPSLILCSNMLVGPVPPGFGNLKMLHVLDLSKNRLSGAIPEELSSMSSLETLDLSCNNLSGSIPSSLTRLNFLSNFNVAYNDLSGSIPSGGQFSTFAAASFEGNPGLCNSSSPSACGPQVPVQPVGRWRKNKGVIIGMAFGIGFGTALLIAAAYLVVSRSHSKIQEAKDMASANGDHLQSAGSRLVLLFHNKDNKEISISDILRGTGNFDETNIVGCGGFGLVYRATLCDGRKVAIKRLSGDFGQMEREFQAEIEALSRAQHQNLVLLQGYCRIGNDRLLIYSYMENGSLDYWLHERLEGGSTLDWHTRLRIAQGSARGLAYLHQSCQPHILHRDIKSSNILLDENFEAHLADFGLARLVTPYDTHVTTDLVGTLGYIPPEYGQSSVATFKGDVYSFGVVLLELLTGRRPVDMSKPKCSRDLISWVVQMRKERREAEVFDPFIYDKEHDEQMKRILDIACLCMSDSPKLRPLTHQLVAWLDSIGLLDG